MKNSKNLLLFLSLFLLLSCSKQDLKSPDVRTQLISGQLGQHLDNILTPYVDELRTLTDNEAGMAIGITRGDSIIYARTFGNANLEKSEKADFRTLFHIASLAKPFTATAIVKLQEEGKLSIEDLLIDHIPEFSMNDKNDSTITLKQILTHTSGIPRHVSSGDWENPTYGPDALMKNLHNVKDLELDFVPGSQFNYSNSAFDLLGIVISRASGQPFHEYVTEKILKPAGMENSTYLKPQDSLPASWAAPYSYGLETQLWEPYPYTQNYLPSSGLQSTIIDMCRWGMLYVNDAAYQEQALMDKDNFSVLTQPHYGTPWGDKIGLSWFLQSYLNRPIIMHSGSDTGFESIMYIYPEDGITIVVMANRDFSRTGRVINAASEIIFDKEPKDYSVSAKYLFAKSYKEGGLEKAIIEWELLKRDTMDIYYSSDDDILSIGAILENGGKWKEAQDILGYYLSMDSLSTYGWRLKGNTHRAFGEIEQAKRCYERTLVINPDYAKGTEALRALSISQ